MEENYYTEIEKMEILPENMEDEGNEIT